jgi:hypothetical protein
MTDLAIIEDRTTIMAVSATGAAIMAGIAVGTTTTTDDIGGHKRPAGVTGGLIVQMHPFVRRYLALLEKPEIYNFALQCGMADRRYSTGTAMRPISRAISPRFPLSLCSMRAASF